MKKLPILTAILCLFCFGSIAQPSFTWAKQVGGSSTDEGKSIGVDALGNVYTVGNFNNIVDLDPGVGIYNITSQGLEDIFVLKLDPLGNFVWAKAIGGIANDNGNSLAIDTAGNILITGFFQGTVDFDPGVGIFNFTSFGLSDIFILKLDAGGNLIWAKQMGGTGDESGNGITVDIAGNVFTTGFFEGTSDFDPSVGIANYNSVGLGDIFVSKLDVAGNYVWTKQFGGTSNEYAYAIVIDNIGNIYTSGFFRTTVDFDPGVGIFNLVATGGDDAFISKIDVSGNFVWAKKMGGTSTEVVYSIALDNTGNPYAVGRFSGTVDFDPGIGINNLTSNGLADIFILKLDVSGNFNWAKQIGGATNNDYGYAIALDDSGYVYTTGFFAGTVDFDPGVGNFNMTSSGNTDVFLSKLNSLGGFVWAKQIIGNSTEIGYSVTIDSAGNIYTTGRFPLIADFDPDIGVYNLTSAGGYDTFILKMAGCTVAPQPGAISGQVIVCQGTTNTYSITAVAGATSYTWTLPNGWTGSSTTNSINTTASATSGNITVTANNACGSSTAQTLAISVNPIYTTNTTVAICQGDSILLAGAYKKTGGNYTDNLLSINRCDSTVVTTLTINPLPVLTISNDTVICNLTAATLVAGGAFSYLWQPLGVIGNTVTVSPNNTTTYTVEGTDANGCKNTASVTITVNQLPNVNLLALNAVCEDAAVFPLTGGTPAGGTYSGLGVNNNQFDAAVAGAGTHTITYTYTDGNTNCSNSATNTIAVKPLPPTPIITVNGTTFTSSAASGNQWYLNGNPINGATSQNYTCTGNGNYTVCVTDINGCKSCSTVLNFTTFGISENGNENEIIVYPNPFNAEVTLRLSKGSGQAVLYNTLGETVYSTQLTTQPLTIYLNEVPTGIYFLQVKNESRIITKKIIKQ